MKLDLSSIAIFSATGFFLSDDTFWQDKKYVDQSSLQKFTWHYAPRDISFEHTVLEFEEIFQNVSKPLLKYSRIILPLSGGLDSRTQATLLRDAKNVASYTYSFLNGTDESKYGRLISTLNKYSFRNFIIPESYLWSKIEKLAEWNQCHAEFTHPRQMAIEAELNKMGDVFFLGHWGDVLFDSMGISEKVNENDQILFIKNKIIKKGGMELAEALWEAWDLPGSFSEYLDEKLHFYLSKIKIDHAGARIRAFKSIHWLPRWTLTNLCVFEKHHPVVLPYCDTRMFDFVCTVPEEYLAGRKIQIEYIQRTAPKLANIPWQPFNPYNLNNYEEFESFKNWPRRGWRKMSRVWNEKMRGKKVIQRNWELQFCGEKNDSNLRSWLFENPKFTEWIPKKTVKEFYNLFRNEDPVYYAHAVSMLLTLSVFSKKVL